MSTRTGAALPFHASSSSIRPGGGKDGDEFI